MPTGTVTFLDGTTVLGTAPVDAAGQATLGVSLGVGNHALTASFAGTGGFADSTSAAVTETVNRAATTVALGSSVNPAVTGQAVTFTATVAAVAPGAGTPTGTVTFQDGNVVLGTVAVGPGGTATFTTSFAAAGGHAITAVYNGDSNFVGSWQALTEQVNAHHPQGDDDVAACVRQPGQGGAGGHVHGHGPRPIGDRHADRHRHVLRGQHGGGAGDARCQRPGALHARLLAHGPVHHPGGLQRRRHLRRQLAVPHRAGQPVMRGEKLPVPHRRGRSGRRALGEESSARPVGTARPSIVFPRPLGGGALVRALFLGGFFPGQYAVKSAHCSGMFIVFGSPLAAMRGHGYSVSRGPKRCARWLDRPKR